MTTSKTRFIFTTAEELPCFVVPPVLDAKNQETKVAIAVPEMELLKSSDQLQYMGSFPESYRLFSEDDLLEGVLLYDTPTHSTYSKSSGYDSRGNPNGKGIIRPSLNLDGGPSGIPEFRYIHKIDEQPRILNTGTTNEDSVHFVIETFPSIRRSIASSIASEYMLERHQNSAPYQEQQRLKDMSRSYGTVDERRKENEAPKSPKADPEYTALLKKCLPTSLMAKLQSMIDDQELYEAKSTWEGMRAGQAGAREKLDSLQKRITDLLTEELALGNFSKLGAEYVLGWEEKWKAGFMGMSMIEQYVMDHIIKKGDQYDGFCIAGLTKVTRLWAHSHSFFDRDAESLVSDLEKFSNNKKQTLREAFSKAMAGFGVSVSSEAQIEERHIERLIAFLQKDLPIAQAQFQKQYRDKEHLESEKSEIVHAILSGEKIMIKDNRWFGFMSYAGRVDAQIDAQSGLDRISANRLNQILAEGLDAGYFELPSKYKGKVRLTDRLLREYKIPNVDDISEIDEHQFDPRYLDSINKIREFNSAAHIPRELLDAAHSADKPRSHNDYYDRYDYHGYDCGLKRRLPAELKELKDAKASANLVQELEAHLRL